MIIIIIIIAPLSMLSEDDWGYLECLYNVCQAELVVEAYSQTRAYMNKVQMNDRVIMTVR